MAGYLDSDLQPCTRAPSIQDDFRGDSPVAYELRYVGDPADRCHHRVRGTGTVVVNGAGSVVRPRMGDSWLDPKEGSMITFVGNFLTATIRWEILTWGYAWLELSLGVL